MTIRTGMSRRECLAVVAAGSLASTLGAHTARALEMLRQGYQTNIWGMPTYYLLRSGALERHGIKVEEFAVASGNLTMQQMVARQVDLGTYAGQSFIIGVDKGDLVGLMRIEEVGRTVRIMVRKELGLSKVEDLKGLKIASQTGSSMANVFTDTVVPSHGLKKGDFQEVRMDVNNMVAALAAKTVDAMVNVEPYNSIAEADGIATPIMDFWTVDRMPVLMAATPDFVAKSPDTVVAYLKAWREVARDFKESPDKVADVVHAFYTGKGYTVPRDTLAKALALVEVIPSSPGDLEPYLKEQADILLKQRLISAVPDWKRALRPDLWAKAGA
jgi:ABC-type nitrate/sulfonate/bicarbonate transport system substrate-binding protein